MPLRLLRRAVLLLFRPAVTFTGRLHYAQKFTAVGLVLLVPLVYVALAYVGQQRKEIQLSAREREGVALVAPLTVLTTHLVGARFEVLVSNGGSRPGLIDDLALIDRLDGQLGADLGTSADWATVRSAIETATDAPGDLPTRVQLYDTAADALLAYIVAVGDQSGLTLDPDLDSYYLMQIMQNELPSLLDVVGRVTDQASYADSNPLLVDSDSFIELGVYNGVVASTHQAIRRAAKTIAARTTDAKIRRLVLDHFARLDVVTSSFDQQLHAAVGNRRIGAALANGADSVRAEATFFATDAATGLDRLLVTRIADRSARAQRVQVGGGVAVVLSIYLFVGFYLSVASPIRKMVATLNAVAVGDLTRRVTVETRDELSTVAVALNDTIAKTEIMTARLGRQASYDTLTGLPNRSFVLGRLDEALERIRQGDRPPMAVLFIDLDRFKIINDSLGHAAGDAVLRTVADRLTRAMRPADLVARLAGDEFVVIAEGLNRIEEAVIVAQRIVDEVSRPITVSSTNGDREINVGGSVGIAFADSDKISSSHDLLRDADVAMYKAKERGRGRVEIFDDAMRTAVDARLAIQEDLRSALETGQIQVHYQPIIDLTSGEVLAFEALVRWEHPTRGMIDARELVEVAEETGLIGPLGAVVLRAACRQAAQWRTTRPGCADLRISVNVSGKQFADPAFVPVVAVALAETGLTADALWLEITETSIMAESDAVKATVDAIRSLGVMLAVDDFGTGYSSLAYLRRFPISAIKIDRSFIAGLGDDPEAEAIVTAIVRLAQALELTVIAEGVESADQLARVQRIGCALAQGFHLGGPCPADQVWADLERSGRPSTMITTENFDDGARVTVDDMAVSDRLR